MNDSTSTVRLEGSFTIDAWDQEPIDDTEGFARHRARVRKTFSGDVVGTSSTELLLASAEGGAQSYCGFEVVTGTLAGRTGTLALRHAAEADGEAAWMTWTVLPGSGTGELSGVRGGGQIERHDDGSHTYWLDLSS